jgi:6-pyruvoyltetrahydropterin/6-carboxytetrahydropterin synthase
VLVAFVVEVEREFRAVQGLASPVRAGRGLPLIAPGAGVPMLLRAGVAFGDEQLTESGWFFDTDAAGVVVQACCDDLARRAWTELFDFRPTVELVARRATAVTWAEALLSVDDIIVLTVLFLSARASGASAEADLGGPVRRFSLRIMR